MQTSSIEPVVRPQPPAERKEVVAPRKRVRSTRNDHRLYHRTQTGIAILICAYVSIAVWRERVPGHSELFPIASWSLFSLVPNTIEDFSVRLLEVDGRPLARALFFEDIKPIFLGATSHDARVVIERFGLALAAGHFREAEEIRRRFEAEYLSKQAHQVRYELVARVYDPMERWNAGVFKSVRTLAAYAMGDR